VCKNGSKRGHRRKLPVRKFLASKLTIALEHPPYSPDLNPNDFFLFPKIKEILIRRHFGDADDIRRDNNGSSEGHSTKPVPKLF
jgi:hypothetical protein